MRPVNLVGVLTIAIVIECGPSPTMFAQPPIARAPSPAAAAAMRTWFDCIECTTAQLAAVAALGDAAVPSLSAVLQSGPVQLRVDGQRTYLEAQWQRMKDYETAHPDRPDRRVLQTKQQYVDTYLKRYVLLNRVRAARALGAINTAESRNALTRALQLPNLPDVLRKEISDALARP